MESVFLSLSITLPLQNADTCFATNAYLGQALLKKNVLCVGKVQDREKYSAYISLESRINFVVDYFVVTILLHFYYL